MSYPILSLGMADHTPHRYCWYHSVPIHCYQFVPSLVLYCSCIFRKDGSCVSPACKAIEIEKLEETILMGFNQNVGPQGPVGQMPPPGNMGGPSADWQWKEFGAQMSAQRFNRGSRG